VRERKDLIGPISQVRPAMRAHKLSKRVLMPSAAQDQCEGDVLTRRYALQQKSPNSMASVGAQQTRIAIAAHLLGEAAQQA